MKKPTWITKHLSTSQIDKIDGMPKLAQFKRQLENFGQYLLAERNFSESTKVNYLSDLLQFLHYLADHGMDLRPADVTPDVVRAYLAWCKSSLHHGAASR